jgi:glutamate-1-semialdehyde 2,1-aminomutase
VTHSSVPPSLAANQGSHKVVLDRSAALFARAEALIPAGVSSPVRAFRKVGGTPVFFREARGAHAIDEDGNRYLDLCMAWGPLILGHAHPRVIEAVQRAIGGGLAFGTAHRLEGELAERVLSAYPYAQLVRFVVSGTEAVATAVRIARASNGRRRLLKFDGCYHGHVDQLMVKAGSGVITQGLADSAGVPASVAADTLVIPLGDIAALERAFAEAGRDLAAAIIEPVPANNGLLLQSREYLQRLRELTSEHGVVLIFDEVITGFRFGFHGYDKLLGLEPDLTTLGKIVGGGLPVAAVLGRRELMGQLAPLGPVYQAGTMAGNPVCLAAGVATLTELAEGGTYQHLDMLGRHLDSALTRHALKAQAQLPRIGPIVWPYFDTRSALPVAASSISGTAIDEYHRRYRGWLAQGVYMPPSAYEVCFLSAAHTTADVDKLLDVLATSEKA